MCACVHVCMHVYMCNYMCVCIHVVLYCSLVAVKVGMTDHVDKSCINGDTLFRIASRQFLETSNKEEKERGEAEGERRNLTWSEEEREKERGERNKEGQSVKMKREDQEGIKPRIKKLGFKVS